MADGHVKTLRGTPVSPGIQADKETDAQGVGGHAAGVSVAVFAAHEPRIGAALEPNFREPEANLQALILCLSTLTSIKSDRTCAW